MRYTLLARILLVIFSYNFLHADKEDLRELKYAKILQDVELNKSSPIAMANLEAEPSAFVHGVNVITGEYSETNVDLILMRHGVEPIQIERYFMGNGKIEGSLCFGWSLNHSSRVEIERGQLNGKPGLCATLFEDHGAGLFFFSNLDSKKALFGPTPISKKSLYGVTNTSSGGISAQTNIKNLTLENYYKRMLKLQDGSASGKNYQKMSHEENEVYRITTDRRRIGTRLNYLYDRCNHENVLSKISYMNCIFRNSRSFPLKPFHHEKIKKGDYVREIQGEGGLVRYHFTYLKSKHHVLSKVERSEAPMVIYLYNADWGKKEKPKSSSISKLKYAEYLTTLKEKILPDGRYLAFDYYALGSNPVIEGDMHLVNTGDFRIGAVKNLYAPLGSDRAPIRLYQFLYHRNQFWPENGDCTVYDALGNKVNYEYDTYLRLVHVNKYHRDHSLYTQEQFHWGSGDEDTYLKAHLLQLADKTLVFGRTYDYDTPGNVIKDTLYGNLSGNSPPISSLGFQNGGECYSKNFAYTSDGYNLMSQETDGEETISYLYAPKTCNLIRKIQRANNSSRRSFYFHNNDAAVVKEIHDDGTSDNLDDLSGVTERRIINYQQIETFPIAYPEAIEEKCIDFSTGSEILIHKVSNVYNERGRLSQQDHFDNKANQVYSLFWEYDSMGHITKETDALGREFKRQYDSNGNLTLEKGPRVDFYKKYTYDLMNRLILEQEIHDDGITWGTSHRYDYMGNRIASVDPYGNETQYLYDAFGRVTQITLPTVLDDQGHPYQPIIKKSYDAMGNITSLVDARGIETKYSYTLRGQVAHIHFADGTSEHKTYNLNGTLKEEIAKNGTKICYLYDGFKRPIQTQTFSSSNSQTPIATATTNYIGSHVSSEIDAMGIVSQYTYYPDGKLKSKQREKCHSTYFYDSLGRLQKTIEQCGVDNSDVIVKWQAYDLLNRVIEERVEDGQGNIMTRSLLSYDMSGNLCQSVAFQQSGQAITTYHYDSHGVPIVVEDAEGHKTFTTKRYDFHNDLGQCVPYQETTDPLGNTSITIQDALGRVVVILRKNAFGAVTQRQEIAYDANGNKVFLKDFIITPEAPERTILTALEYDSVNRLVNLYEALGTPEQKQTKFIYNAFGQKQDIIKADGKILTHSYDFFGRLASIISSDHTIHYVYHYDLNGNPLHVEDLICQTSTKRTYDNNNNLSEETLANGYTLAYSYDRIGRPLQISLPDRSTIDYRYHACFLEAVERKDNRGQLRYTHFYQSYDQAGHLIKGILIGDGGSIDYQYDRLGRLKETNSIHWKETIDRYDSAGNLLEKTLKDSLGTTACHYVYDSLYQLSSEQGATSHSYLCDSHYNRLNKDGIAQEVNALNQLLNDGFNTYKYDLNGNIIQKTSSNATIDFTYDAYDRLIELNDGTLKAVYTYDDNNRRMSKTLSTIANGSWIQTTQERYLYQGQNEIGTCDVNGTPLELRLLGIGKGAEIGAAIAIEKGDNLYIPIHDHTGSIACLCDAKTGDAVETYRYSAFGEELFDSALISWRFASKRVDPESGFLYFGRRYYSPDIGRWVTPDPIGREGGPNLYAYVLNSPLTHFDMYGLFGIQSDFFSSIATGVSGFLNDCRDFIGSSISSIGNTFRKHCPIPILRDSISAFGHLIQHGSLHDYKMEYQGRHSNFNQVYGANYTSELRMGFVPGIDNTPNSTEEAALMISRAYADSEVYYTNNATHGHLTDIGETICQKANIPTNSVLQCVKMVKQMFSQMGPFGRVLLHGFSQGGQIIDSLRYYFPSEMLKRVDVITYGSAKMVSKKEFGSAINYVSTHDSVPFMADPLGVASSFFSKDIEIEFLNSKALPFFDHQFRSDTYQKALNDKGSTYIKEFKR